MQRDEEELAPPVRRRGGHGNRREVDAGAPRRELTLMHVGRRARDVAQARRLELAPRVGDEGGEELVADVLTRAVGEAAEAVELVRAHERETARAAEIERELRPRRDAVVVELAV